MGNSRVTKVPPGVRYFVHISAQAALYDGCRAHKNLSGAESGAALDGGQPLIPLQGEVQRSVLKAQPLYASRVCFDNL